MNVNLRIEEGKFGYGEDGEEGGGSLPPPPKRGFSRVDRLQVERLQGNRKRERENARGVEIERE